MIDNPTDAVCCACGDSIDPTSALREVERWLRADGTPVEITTDDGSPRYLCDDCFVEILASAQLPNGTRSA